MSMSPDPALSCPFCARDFEPLYEGVFVFSVLDRFPVSEGHALLITRRHVATWFEASVEEQNELTQGIEMVRRVVELRLSRRPDGWNVGFNSGSAAGQTVAHLHLHLIPRWHGDVEDPRGGVRGVIPARRDYSPGKAER